VEFRRLARLLAQGRLERNVRGRTMKGKQLSRMLLLATNRHDGQFDKGGNPYILHPLKVMHYLKTDDEELMCIAIGHDLVEDTFKSAEDGIASLQHYGMSERVIAGILALTKIPTETFDDYKSRVKANPDAVKVKMADLRHNSDIRRLKGVRAKDIERIERYHRFYLELQSLESPNASLSGLPLRKD
jgi:(p)ppGpp synthase/HD superfamily hydrolase